MKMRSPCRAFIAPVDVRPTGVAARPGCLVPRLAGRLARGVIGLDRLVVALLVVAFFAAAFLAATFFGLLAVIFRAASFFAVVFFAVVFFAVVFFAVVFFAVVFFAVVFFAVVFFAVVFFAVMVDSLVTFHPRLNLTWRPLKASQQLLHITSLRPGAGGQGRSDPATRCAARGVFLTPARAVGDGRA